MRILTLNGYKTFAELDGKRVQLINADGCISEGRVWCSGEKEVIKINLSNGQEVKCTPDHIFKTAEGKEEQAKDLLGKRILAIPKTKQNPMVISIKSLDGKHKVYDFNEPLTNWGIVENCVVHNCGEIPLENGEPCNLVELFPYKVEQSKEEISKILRLITRYAKRVTFTKYDWEVSRNVVYKNRRIGVSLSGIQDWILYKGYSGEELINQLDKMYKAVVEADKEYSKEIDCEVSKKLTTVKPSGTVSLLAGVSPGMHWNYSDYYIRRIRFQKNDPLLNTLRLCGYYMEKDAYSTDTIVVEFPIKAPTADRIGFKSAEDVTIEEQIAFQSLLQYYWADNSVSCTITFKKDEIEKIGDLLIEYKDKIKSTSLLPYSGHGYKQAPYEPISKEKYEELIKAIKFTPHDIGLIDDTELTLLDNLECTGGSCPIR